MNQHRVKPVHVTQSPPEWHTHEIDPVNWFKAVKAELHKIEEYPPSK